MLNIPIVICNFNRLDCLQKQLESFKKRGWNDITILDMSSTWKPLLDWYGTCGYRIVTLPNEGPYSWWKTKEYDRVKGGYYIYTDSDIVIPDTCPNDILEKFVSILENTISFGCGKVGPTLRTHDVPDSLPFKHKVLKTVMFPSREFCQYIGEGVHVGLIDTTFAMYAPGKDFDSTSPWRDISPCICVMVDAPYEAVHLPWYMDFSKPTNEDRNYLETAGRWSTNMENIREAMKGIV